MLSKEREHLEAGRWQGPTPHILLQDPNATLTLEGGLSSGDGARLHRVHTAQGLVPAGAINRRLESELCMRQRGIASP